MENNQKPLLSQTMTYGALLGFIFVLYNLLNYYLKGTAQISGGGFFGFLLQAGFIWFFGKRYKAQFLGNKMTYSQAVGYGFLISLFSGIILSAYTYIYYTQINIEGISQLVSELESVYETADVFSEEQINSMLTLYEKFLTPGIMFISGIFGNAIIGLIISLLTAIFLKTSDNPFTEAND